MTRNGNTDARHADYYIDASRRGVLVSDDLAQVRRALAWSERVNDAERVAALRSVLRARL